MAGRPLKYGAKLDRITIAIPEPLHRNLEEMAGVLGISLNEFIVKILSKEIPTLDMLDKRIAELRSELDELLELRERILARQIQMIPDEIRKLIEETLDQMVKSGSENKSEVEEYLTKVAKFNDLPESAVKEYGFMIFERLKAEARN